MCLAAQFGSPVQLDQGLLHEPTSLSLYRIAALLPDATANLFARSAGHQTQVVAPDTNPHYPISSARKSFTLVNVGPVTTKSPSGAKKL